VSRPNWFVALPLPAAAGWQQAAAAAPEALRRFAAADLHCTVAFLGPCGEERALAAWQALCDQPLAALLVSAGGWRGLGPSRQPSAYGLTFAQGRQPLEQLLVQAGGRALQAAGCPPSAHAPLPHITLLRPRRREAAQWCEPMQQWMQTAPLPPEPALLQELALYTWSEDRRERLFQIVRSRPLPPPT